nr:hypothetical protein [uncultured Rhodopila sp.]
MRLLHFVTITVAAAIVIAAPGARAADPDFCRDYARSAVEQAHRAEHIRSCAYLIDSPRFSPDWRSHYEWCLNAHHHEADEERERRHEALERCGYR